MPSSRGGWLETLADSEPHMIQEKFLPSQRQTDPDVIKAFGSATPPSSEVVLHYAGDPPAGVPRQPVPVILVHGAAVDGEFWWTQPQKAGQQNLPDMLRQQGYQVYALTFAHNQDDNYLQEQELADAVARVKTLTGASQVDLVAHSKGNIPARMYVSNFHQNWMTPYQNDVRRLVMVAAPNGGLDYDYRHPALNYGLFQGSQPTYNCPMIWDHILWYGQYDDASNYSMASSGPDYWPGQRQLLARWDQTYPLPENEPDWYTTYYGGQGFVSDSRGIDAEIADSGNFMQHLEATPINPNVQVALLAGDMPDVPGFLDEDTGPSDGLVFVKSALDVPAGTNVVAEKVMPYNHVALVTSPEPLSWIAGVLGSGTTAPLRTTMWGRRRGGRPGTR
ncbi:MAG: lipase family alpha/beta hydrolase [Candidatus Xenobia bacterium]